jgi:CRP/FNR family cyclic AMP-dependent transcriptional regulator
MVTNELRVLWHLKKIPLLEKLTAEEMSQVAREVTVHEARKRRVIYMPGDPGDSVYFVNGGRVKISRVTPDGKELTLYYRTPEEMFGDACLIDGGPREEMAEAVDNVLLCQVPQDRVKSLIARNGAFCAALAMMLCNQRRELERKMEDLIFKDVESKLAELLLKLSESYGVQDSRGTLVSVKVTHQEMANLIGSTRETVSLTLSQFKKKNLITTQGRKVIITDKEALESLL